MKRKRLIAEGKALSTGSSEISEDDNPTKKTVFGGTSSKSTYTRPIARTRDDLLIYQVDPSKQNKRMGVSPVAALHYKQRQQDLKANRIDQIREEERQKAERKRMEAERSEFITTPPVVKTDQGIDMHAIKAKA